MSRQFRSRLWRAVPILVGAVALMLGFVAGCGGDGSGDATSTPPRSTAFPVPGRTTPTPLPPLGPTSYRFLYSEFGMEQDVIWSIDPAEPADRVQVAAVPHKAGWAIKPALSPDGEKIAYNAMPEGGINASTDAETYILDMKSAETKLVAQRVDLLTVPRWSPDGGLLFLRRDVGEDVTVILVELSTPGEEGEEVRQEEGEEEGPPPIRTVLRQHVSDVLAYVPLGFDAEEAAMYFVQIQGGTESGTYLGRYAPATGEAVATATAVADATATAVAATPTPTPTASPTPTPAVSPTPTSTPVMTGSLFLFLTDQIARDYSLSPDASRVAFLVPGLVDGQFVARTYIASIRDKNVAPLPVGGLSAGDHLSPIWHPDGDKATIGQLPAGDEPGRVAVVPLDGGDPTFLPPPEPGFDQPLSWSPDGKFLAVRSFQGDSFANPGPPFLVFVSPAGQRPSAPDGAEFEPIGWIAVE